MKFNHCTVVFDLETTATEPVQAITEIGAVVFDPNLYRILGRFQSYVRPDIPVTQKSLDITGHKVEDLENAPSWKDVAPIFEQWVVDKTGGNIKKVRLAAWGCYFDTVVLRAQYARAGLSYPFSGTAIDVKTAAMMWCALSGRRTDKLSVQKCMEHMGLTPLGPYHRADIDADATGQIFERVMADLGGGVWVGPKQYLPIGPLGGEGEEG